MPLDLHPALYIAAWILCSGSVILSNKYILDTAGFRFPIALTTWHLIFASALTQLLRHTSTALDGVSKIDMDFKTYMQAILPIGVLFSVSLICSNQAYLFLSVPFIQMLKAITPAAVLVIGWTFDPTSIDLPKLKKVAFIVIGVMIASYGEIKFQLTGFVFQAFGIVFESSRLVMVQRLLDGKSMKMDPLVSLYYFAPICALINGVMCIIFEGSKLSLADIQRIGYLPLVSNAAVAFCLNVSVVFLIGKTSSLVLALSGVLKDILLVAVSFFIWTIELSLLQLFGYSMALSGLVYYKIGAQGIMNLIRAPQERPVVLPFEEFATDKSKDARTIP